jgi:hypothetical protein
MRETKVRKQFHKNLANLIHSFQNSMIIERNVFLKGQMRILAISIGDTQQNDARHEKESFDSEFVMNLVSSEQEALAKSEEVIQWT